MKIPGVALRPTERKESPLDGGGGVLLHRAECLVLRRVWDRRISGDGANIDMNGSACRHVVQATGMQPVDLRCVKVSCVGSVKRWFHIQNRTKFS
jgi:hypothetical protein